MVPSIVTKYILPFYTWNRRQLYYVMKPLDVKICVFKKRAEILMSRRERFPNVPEVCIVCEFLFDDVVCLCTHHNVNC